MIPTTYKVGVTLGREEKNEIKEGTRGLQLFL